LPPPGAWGEGAWGAGAWGKGAWGKGAWGKGAWGKGARDEGARDEGACAMWAVMSRRLTLSLISAAAVLVAAILGVLLLLGHRASLSPALARAVTLGAQAALPPATLSPNAEQSQGVIPIHSAAKPSPDWRSNGGWRQEGFGVSHLDGRVLLTVDYAHGHQLIAYSIAEAPVLPGQRAGFSSFTLGHRAVVSWSQAGQSCLLSSVNVPRSTLLKLARS
jgi:hypothetical protein